MRRAPERTAERTSIRPVDDRVDLLRHGARLLGDRRHVVHGDAAGAQPHEVEPHVLERQRTALELRLRRIPLLTNAEERATLALEEREPAHALLASRAVERVRLVLELLDLRIHLIHCVARVCLTIELRRGDRERLHALEQRVRRRQHIADELSLGGRKLRDQPPQLVAVLVRLPNGGRVAAECAIGDEGRRDTAGRAGRQRTIPR